LETVLIFLSRLEATRRKRPDSDKKYAGHRQDKHHNNTRVGETRIKRWHANFPFHYHLNLI